MGGASVKTMDIHTANIAFIGIGGCGRTMLRGWHDRLPAQALCIDVDREKRSLGGADEFCLRLSRIKSKGATVDYAESVRAEVASDLADQWPLLEQQLRGRESVVVMAGLGGVVGTWASQLICNHLVAVGKRVLTVLVMPFAFERERVKVAEAALPGFNGEACQLLCFNDYLIKHAPDDISMNDAFDLMNQKAFELLNMPD